MHVFIIPPLEDKGVVRFSLTIISEFDDIFYDANDVLEDTPLENDEMANQLAPPFDESNGGLGMSLLTL